MRASTYAVPISSNGIQPTRESTRAVSVRMRLRRAEGAKESEQMFEMKYSGNLSVHVHDKEVQIEITEERSGVYAFVVNMPSEDFLNAIARSGNKAVRFWLNEGGIVGKRREVKTEVVPFDMVASGEKHPKDTDPNGYRTPATVKALESFEVDGWQASERDMWNWHNRVMLRRKPHQRVSFVRWVDGE